MPLKIKVSLEDSAELTWLKTKEPASFHSAFGTWSLHWLGGYQRRQEGIALEGALFGWMILSSFLGGGFKYVLFSSLLGEMIQFD